MKNLLYTLLAVLALASCSKEEEVVTPPAPNKYTLTVTADTGGAVSSPGGTYNEGSKITVTATPDGMYLFKEWSDGSTQNPREITVTSNLTLKASFVKKTYPLAVTVEGEGTVQEEVIIQGSTTETEYNAGTTVRLTATPNEGWVFAGWSGDVESEELVIEVAIEKGMAITASFIISSFTVSLQTEGSGRILNGEDIISRTYSYGDTLTLVAQANFENEFYQWSEGIDSNLITNRVVITENKEITAFFREAIYTLGIQNYFGGTSSYTRENGSNNDHFSADSKVQLIASPDEGYKFHSWFGSINSTENPIEIVITDTLKLRATFYKSDLDVQISALNYEHEMSYPIDQFIATIESVSATTALKTSPERVLFPGKVNSNRLPDKNRQDFLPARTVELLKENDGVWRIFNEYPLDLWGPRNTKIKSNKILVLGANEIGPLPQDWEDNMYLGNISDSGIEWKRVTSDDHMGYFHSGSFGDFNGDGNTDVVGVSGTPPNGSESFYVSDSTGEFELLNHQTQIGVISSDFSAELYDLDQDGSDEILLPKKEGKIQVLKYDLASNKFFLLKEITSNLVSSSMGPTSTQLSDFNNDGFVDLVVARESESGTGFDVWLGGSNMEFTPAFSKVFSNEELAFRELTLLDVNEDGFMDIILNGQRGTIPETYSENQGRIYTETNFKYYIWLNTGLNSFSNPVEDFIVTNTEIIYIVPYMENGKLHLMGPNHFNVYGTMDVDYDENTVGFKIWDITIPLN